jgi:ketosteroid isomerase-like protein
MKRFVFFSLLIISSTFLFAQSTDVIAIKKLMTEQVAAWNNGNIDDFMKGYWNNDSLAFVGQSGITYGYNNTLNNYKKKYDSPAKMGKLFFSDLKYLRLSDDFYFITGKWFLKRTAGDVGGYYTLLFRKINGQWFIINDHTS